MDETLLEILGERLTDNIQKANVRFLTKIGESLKKIKTLTPTQAHQLIQILKYSGNYEELISEISAYTGIDPNEIDNIFSSYSKKDLNFAKKFYEYRNIPFTPFDQNIPLKMQTQALANLTKNAMANFTRSRAIGYTLSDINGIPTFYGMRETYEKLLDEALLNVSQGKETFDESMRRTLKELGGSGLKTLDYASGKSYRLDSMITMHLKSGLRELHNENQRLLGEEYGADGMEISVHEYPAEDHQEAQGRQFTYEEFNKLQDTGVGIDYTGKTIDMHLVNKEGISGLTHRPISEYNCYHYTFSIVLGVSQPEYSEDQLKKIIDDNNKGFEYEGKHYTMYEGTQLQRNIEREIRKQKDIQILARASGDDQLVGESQLKITQLTRKYNELCNISGLSSKAERMRVSGYRRVAINKDKPNYIGINVKTNPELYNKIVNTKQILHTTDNLKEIYDSNYITGNLQVNNIGDKISWYGHEGVLLKPEALDYSVELYNNDRGNINTGNNTNKFKTNDINEFIDQSGVNSRYSTAVVEKMPFKDNIKAIVTYEESDNLEFWKMFATKFNIPLTINKYGYKPPLYKKGIEHSTRS